MPSSGWEENSQLVLQKLQELAETDKAIVAHVTACQSSIVRLKTIVTLLAGILVVASPLVYNAVSEHEVAQSTQVSKMVMILQEYQKKLDALIVTDAMSRKTNWQIHNEVHKRLEHK